MAPETVFKALNPLEIADLSLTAEERDWLANACPFLKPTYLDYLAKHQFKPEQLDVVFHPTEDDPAIGQLDITVEGLWVDTILWEVPLMALLSEAYFVTIDKHWNYDGQEGSCYFVVPSRRQVPL